MIATVGMDAASVSFASALVLHTPLEQQNAAHHDQQGHDQKENREERAPLPRRPTAATACHAFSCHSIAPNSNS